MAGFYSPDAGSSPKFQIRGRDIEPWSESYGKLRAMAFVHQELTLVDGMSITDNMRFGDYECGAFWRINWKEERSRVNKELIRLGINADPMSDVASLDKLSKTRLAIAKAVYAVRQVDGSGIIVLDEPTASMPKENADRLLGIIRELAEDGNAVLFVSHHLSEVVQICDRVTVLRNGRVTTLLERGELSESGLAEAMVGSGSVLPIIKERARPSVSESEGTLGVFKCERIQGRVIRDFNFNFVPGEIVGVTGLSGSGFEEVPYLLAGVVAAARGKVSLGEQEFVLGKSSTREFVKAGIVLVPGDRGRSGLVGSMSIRENVTLPRVRAFRNKGLLRLGPERNDVNLLMRDYSILVRSVDDVIGSLSGGNQQRAIMAKWIATGPRVLLVHEPVQGVDIAAKAAIFRILQGVAELGCVVLVASTEADDLAAICDRVLIVWRGAVDRVLAGADVTESRIVFASGTERVEVGSGR
jgi:ribose transport system ATP-binding protein